MAITLRYGVFSVCVCACAAGCHRDTAPSPEATAAVETPAPVVPAAAKTEAKPAAAPELADSKLAKANAPAFTPPFPERLDLFEAPKRAQSMVQRDDEHGESVELKGFINVDQPKVVLSIDRNISLVSEGGEKYGVRVISIQPPSVVLQRGRKRWTATLE